MKMRAGKSLLVALAILALPTLGLHTFAQRPTPERAPLATQRMEPQLPDLVPDLMHWSVSASAIALYNPDIDVVLDVDNRTDVAAPESVATVAFRVNGVDKSVSQPVAPVPAHGTSRATFRVPKGCFDPVNERCYHTVTVDSANQVQEANEANNTDNGYELLANVSGITNINPPTALGRQSSSNAIQVKGIAPAPGNNPTKTAPRPDLAPFEAGSHYGGHFCQWSAADQGEKNGFSDVELLVIVKNESYSAGGESHGGGDAPASTVEVAYKVYVQAGGDEYSWRSFYRPVPPLLRAVRSSPTTFQVPKLCFPPGSYKDPNARCEFKITVDYGNKVRETHENNNTVSDSCRHYSY